jgi:cytochrome c oxidase subunit 2
MTFSNSAELLSFHWVAYSIYAAIIISIVAWFGYNLTRKEAKSIVRIPFYWYMAFLVLGGVGHHIFTYNAIPWVSQDITRDEVVPDAKYNFEIKDHKWIGLPDETIKIQCGQTVKFDVKSHDLVYGFGLFRQDGSLVLQMQVNPGTDVNGILDSNDIVWTFNHNGVFDLTSTEYSGPAQYTEDGKDLMLVKNFIEVVGCKGDNK